MIDKKRKNFSTFRSHTMAAFSEKSSL